MTIRDFKSSDVQILRVMERGFPYPDPEGPLELIRVVCDDDGKPLMAAAAKKLIEIYLWSAPFERPHAALHGMRLIQADMASVLRAKGYRTAEAFLPPMIADEFGRRLERSFGAKKNWASWEIPL